MPYQQIGPQRSAAGIMPIVSEGAEAASQTFKAGAPLIRNAAGFWEECGAAPALVGGFAVNDAHNNAVAGGATIQYHMVRAGVEFDGVLLATLTQTMLGEEVGLVKGGDGIWYLSAADAGDQCLVTGYNSRYKIGSVNPVVEFQVASANIQEL